jgi:hypothetical protein
MMGAMLWEDAVGVQDCMTNPNNKAELDICCPKIVHRFDFSVFSLLLLSDHHVDATFQASREGKGMEQTSCACAVECQ